MGTVSQKITYTAKAIDDIQKALEEKGFNMSGVELMRYGDFIRKITGQGGGGGSSEPTAPSFINKIESASFILYTTKKVNIKYLSNKLLNVTRQVNDVSTINVLYNKLLYNKLLYTTKKVNIKYLSNKLLYTTKKVNSINDSSASGNLENTIKLESFINYKGNNTTSNVKVSFYNQKQIKQIEMEDIK